MQWMKLPDDETWRGPYWAGVPLRQSTICCQDRRKMTQKRHPMPALSRRAGKLVRGKSVHGERCGRVSHQTVVRTLTYIDGVRAIFFVALRKRRSGNSIIIARDRAGAAALYDTTTRFYNPPC
uniref:Uncharacterized protein n=1 Tax=Plectus sambesii TaxID=2011161 RepID=A0A914UIK9_9BILA